MAFAGAPNLRVNTRRGGAPLTLTPHAKPVVNLEEWDANTALDEDAMRTVEAIEVASKQTPLPLKFMMDDSTPSRPGTPSSAFRNKLIGGVQSGSRPSTPTARHPNASQHALLPNAPIQTPQQFHDWYAAIERAAAHGQEAHVRARLTTVAGHLDTCDALVRRIDETDEEVESMLERWRLVEEGGRSLKDACQRMLEERDRLIGLTEEIGLRLEYFQELEHATRMLNHPGESLVLQSDFLYMVERVEACIDYLRAHRHFREAELYLLRFQQCMTRAMTLIKMFFVGSLRALSADVTRRLAVKDISLTAQQHLLYTRFASVARTVSPLLRELERRAVKHPDELGALLAECHAAYFSARRALLVGRLAEEIRGLDPTRTELVELTRAGCSYLKQLCTDEFALFRTFFSSGEDQLYHYLEKLCDYLYDDLRPRILHEQRLTALCEVCTVLQALMVLDVTIATSSNTSSSSSAEDDDDDDDEDSDDEEEEDEEEDYSEAEEDRPRLHIGRLLQMVLQDAQTRLFFKAQSVVQAEIRYYAPKQDDLAYPSKLLERKPAGAHAIREKETVSERFQVRTKESRETWYPTVQKTVWVLSQLHDFVQPAIFEDIAQEALSVCRQSLVAASEMIKPRAPLDGALFLLRHLLVLKQLAHNLDLAQQSDVPVVSGSVTDALANVLGRTSSLLPTALLTSLGMAHGDDAFNNARHDIDRELTSVCEDVIAQLAEPLCTPLRSWVDRVRIQRQQQQSARPLSATVQTPEWAQQGAAEALDSAFRLACERDLRANAARVRLYLEDARTAGVLLTHARERVTDEYGGFLGTVRELYGDPAEGKFLNVAGEQALLLRCSEEDNM